ncbi:MAG TPA: hypothetical protein VGC37_17690 [Friedmanniella sp.]
MNVHIFRVPSHSAGCAVARGLQIEGLATRAGVRNHQAYVVVRSDRTDVSTLVRSLVPVAVSVNLEHLPAPLPEDSSLLS